MKWFEGSIPEAINVSKQRGSLFIVYIHGSDEQSQQMNDVLDSSEVEQILGSNGAVALKIENTSQECQFFSQIYPVVVVPSLFCIGDGGVPLEVIGGYVTQEECVKKLQQVIQTQTDKKGVVQEEISVTKTTPTAAAPSLSTSTEPGGVAPSTSTEGVAGQQEAQGATGGDDSSTDLNQKMERAKELMEKKREEKEREAYEKKKQSEVDRRKLGQDLQKLKQNQQEQQMKELKEQMRKDKEEEKAAKEKIKAQIARDREERAAKYKRDKEERETASQEAKKAKLMEQQQQAAEQEAMRSQTARIQVRLPDGSSVTQNFDATQTFQALQDFVSQRVGGAVSLSTTYPKHTFTHEDMQKTFRELQLAPSAVVMAIPGSRSSGSSSSSGSQVSSSSNFFSFLLSPIWMIWNFVYTLLFGRSQGDQGSSSRSTEQQEQPEQQSSQPADDTQTSTRRNRPKTAYQRRTGPRRLTDLQDDDEDMSTYNGNSTQQL